MENFTVKVDDRVKQEIFNEVWDNVGIEGPLMLAVISIDTDNALTLSPMAKPIPPKPQVRVEYEKCKFNHTWEAVKAVETEEIFFLNSDGKYAEPVIQHAISHKDRLYRRIEKPIDWREEASEYLAKCRQLTDSCDLSLCTSKPNSDDPNDLHEWVELQSEFLGMCRIALRATGELK